MSKEKPKMRLEREVKVTQIIEPEEDEPLHIKRIVIAGKEYSLDILNSRRMGEGDEYLHLDFNDGDYKITIDKEGISFERHVYRPNHDHGDDESLQVGVDDSKMGVIKGEMIWRERFPYKREGYDFFHVQFGDVRVDY